MLSMPNSKKHSWLTPSNMLTFVLVGFIVAMIIFPEVKAGAITGLMKIGLFRPDLSSATSDHNKTKISLSPDVAFIDENNKSVNLTSLKGRVIFINFWADWCPPCIAEMPGISSLHKKFLGDSTIVFIMADVDGDLQKSKKFMDAHKYDLPLFRLAGSPPTTLFRGTLPTTTVINKEGEIVFHEQGVANYDFKKFEMFLKQLASR